MLRKSEYLDYDDDEYKGIKDLEHLFDEINDDYYKPILKVLLTKAIKNMKLEVIRIKHYQYNNILMKLYHI